MDGGSFFPDLSLLRERRWKPERLFLLFTAYFDESNTHGPTPDMIMAAFMGTVRGWELLLRKAREFQRVYGFEIFHATDLRHSSGQFRGWGVEKRSRLVGDLAAAIRDHLTEGVTITLPYALYRDVYRAPPVPKGMRLDTQYGLCFRACLWRLVQVVSGDNQKKHRLNVVIEDGHKNIGDVIRVFNEVNVEYTRLGFPILGTITVAKKADCLPLMIADFQAHASSLSDARLKRGEPGYFEMVGERLPPPGKAAITRLDLSADALRAHKANWETATREEKRQASEARKKKARVHDLAASGEQPS
jgi:hypothetical protein